jgi:putative membrane-bound dehydrogenase-like protein
MALGSAISRYRLPSLGLCVAATIGGLLGRAAEPSLRIAPHEPAAAQETFHVLDGFRLDLIAAEPLVTSPVAMAYDERGRAWVVEMNDYPYTDKTTDVAFKERTTDKPLGKVRILEDVDGDGVFDRSSVLAEDLSWPTGIALYGGGCYVAATPDLWYLKDTDGDGRADVRRQVFTGFRKLNVQAVINNLAWGLDGKIYGAGASNGGRIETVGRPGRNPVTLARNDFCFDPRTEEFELLAGGARFGNCFDDWGRRFICNIRNPAQHVVLPSRYLLRNPHLPLASAVQDVAEAGDAIPVFRRSPPEPWRVLNAERLAAAGDRRTPRSETAATGFVTSAAGVTVYRGTAYPERYRGNLFLGEVAGNLIHRQRLRPDGVTFRSERADPGVEFVASTDNWFRPVNFCNAPDGTLHVLDMYRETIEHPWSIADDLKARLDLESGRDRGRIYRLSPPGFQPPRPPNLGSVTTAELVSQLTNRNSWWRETAQRLLLERQDRSATPALQALLHDAKPPLGRLHALWTLAGLGTVERSDLLGALHDEAPGLREHAVLLAESKLSKDSELLNAVLSAANDGDIRVRFQAALTLGEVGDTRAAAALGGILRRDLSDPWMRAAVMSARPSSAAPLLEELLMDEAVKRHAAAQAVVRELAFVVGSLRDMAAVRQLLRGPAMTGAAASGFGRLRLPLVAGLGEGLRRSKSKLAGAVEDDQLATTQLLATFAEAGRTALDERATDDERELALAVLAFAPWSAARPALETLLDPRQSQALSLAAARTAAGMTRPEAAELLLAGWSGYSPALRGEVVDALSTRTEYFGPLFDAIERGIVPATYVSPTRRALFLKHADAKIRARAEKLFNGDTASPRKEIVAQLLPALQIPGNAERGRAVLKRDCAACHRFGDAGHDVGPNLAQIRHRSPAEMLIAILDPNREVGPNFMQYAAALDDGRVVIGLVASETPTSITLRRAENQQETVLRGNIEQLASTGLSLMPEGFEKKLTPQDLADLIALLRAGP